MSDDEEDNKKTIKPKEIQTNTLISEPTEDKKEDEVLSRLDEISKAKPIKEEPRESVEKQILKSQIKQESKPTPKTESVEENPNALDAQDEFFDFESKKVAKDTELVTMLVFDEVGPIVGVDEKVYGPFRPQDLVTLPLVNAKVFFKNRKGRQVKI
jgi:DNA replication factor GINS